MAESTPVELIISNALKLPGVKVNRKEFLTKTLVDQISTEQLKLVLEKGPVEANISSGQLKKIAKSIVEKRTLQTSTASFAAGLPGGVAMAATIPADTIQFFGVALKLAQELAYLYGYKDMWLENQIDIERVKGELILFLGVMFGVGGSASILKVFSSKLSQQIIKKLPQKALTKTLIYPIVKKVAALIGVKMTKDTFAKSFAKAVPVLGGVVSGGLTYASMKKMGNRLNDAFFESMTYSEADLKNDFNLIKKEMPDIIDADFIELENQILNKS